MRSPARAFAHAAIVGGLSIVALASACSSEDEAPPAAPAPNRDPAPKQAEGDITPSAPSATGPACEELGRLVGTSLEAKLMTPTERSIVLPLANRPAPSRLAVLASGAAGELVGKTVALGAAENASFETCTHCFVIALGCAEDCSTAAWFFPRSGTATFTSVASDEGEPFEGVMRDVVLEHVRVDAATGASTPVPGGACLHVQELSFDAVARSADAVDGGSSSSSSSGGDAGQADGGTTSSGGLGKTGPGRVL